MQRARAALIAIKNNPPSAVYELEKALEGDRDEVVRGLAAFLAAALSGVVIDPESL